MNRNSTTSSLEDIDVKEICLDILRDLYSASRQLMMYPIGHPITNETLKKPLERLNDIFSFKRSFVIQIYNQQLVVEGLLMENNVFVKGLLNDFTKHSISVIEFSSDLIIGDLYQFLSQLHEGKAPIDDYFQKYLENKDVKTIKLNTSRSLTLYNFEETVIGSTSNKFMLNDRIKEIIDNNQNLIIAYYLGRLSTDEDISETLGIDLRLPFLVNHFASQISEIPENYALKIFKQVIYSTNWLGESADQQVLNGIQNLWQDYAGRSEDISILLPVYEIFKSVGATDDVLEYVFDKATLIKLKAVREAEEIIRLLSSNQARQIDFQLLRKTVFKLATDKYSRPLEQLLEKLLACLSSRVMDTRQRSLRLTIEAVETLADGSFWDIYSNLVKEVISLALNQETSAEIIELIGWIAEKSIETSQWEELKICVQSFKTITEPDDICKLTHDRLVELSESPILNDILVEAVFSGQGGTELYEAIAVIASNKVATVLVERIDSPDKAIRARVIKSLVRMGDQAGSEVIKKFAEIVGAGETSDDNDWYRLRNMLRVLGQIKYLEVLPYFDILAGWKQSRIKHEVISACEAMESSSTGTVLSKLAVDQDREIRKAAIIAMGMSNHPDMIKFLRSLFDNPRTDRALIVAAIGRIGGSFTRDTLIDLYENSDIYKDLDISKKEEQNIKVAILKALSNIGDDVSRSKIELYSKANKSKFFKKDVLSETALVLLSGHKK